MSSFAFLRETRVCYASTVVTRVLVVDDFADTADAIKMLVELRGLRCETARSMKEALEIAATFDPHIAILDLSLPDGSGYDLARELRRRATHPLHLSAVTGLCGPDAEQRSLSAGFDLHVVKPTSVAKIEQILRAAQRTLVM